MPKYLVAANYVGEGISGLIKEGASGRLKAIKKLVESVGGKVESVHYAFGEYDVYVIADLPDNKSALALSLTTNASGAVNLRTTVLLTPAEVDEAVKLTPKYRKPGG